MKKDNNIEDQIEQLAVMVNRGFDTMETRFDSTDKRIKMVEANMGDRITDLKDNLGRIENNNSNRFERLEDNMRVVKTALEIE